MNTADAPRSLIESVVDRTVRPPGAEAWFDLETGTSLNRRGWRRQIEEAAEVIDERGGDRRGPVGYIGTNHPVTWTTALAAWVTGRDFWPINYRWSSSELRRAVDLLDDKPAFVVGDPAGLRLAADGLVDEAGVEVMERERLVSRLEKVDRVESSEASVLDDGPDERGRLVMATGGTTGDPRLVALDEDRMAWGARMFATMTDLGEDDRVLVAAPNFHVAGFAALTTAAIQSGVGLVVARRFAVEPILEAVAEGSVTATLMVPTMWRRLMEAAETRGERLEHLRFGICGGAPMRPSLVDRADDLGFELLQGYGLTEAGPMVTLMPPGSDYDNARRRRRSAGIAPSGVEVRILDGEGEERPPGESGEIAVRGPNVVDGYLATRESTEGDFVDGLLRTGDVGYLDREGYLYVAGRRDDLVITGGEKVVPAQVEAVLEDHSHIGDAAVFGVDDEQWGQRVVAVVTPGDGAELDEAMLRAVVDWAKRRIASYKVPREMSAVEELPETAAGKVSRSHLRELWSEATGPFDADARMTE